MKEIEKLNPGAKQFYEKVNKNQEDRTKRLHDLKRKLSKVDDSLMFQ